MLAGGTFASFAYLSQSERFQRKWPSLYAAVEDGQGDCNALRQLLMQQLPYSLLSGAPNLISIWLLPLDVRRISSQQTAQDVGVEQIQALAEARQACLEALDIVAADGKYGNGRFFHADWNARPASQIARKIARLAQRQARNAQRTASSSQKGPFCCQSRLKFDW